MGRVGLAALALGLHGCVIVLGDFEEAPATTPACDAGCASDGTWAKTFGDATGTSVVTGVAVGPDGSVVAAGTFTGSINFGGDTLVSAGAADLFLVKLDRDGGHVWSKRFGDAVAQDAPPIVAVGADGAVLLAGGFAGTVDLGGGPLTAASQYGSLFYARFEADGKPAWGFVRGDGHGQATSIALDSTGAVRLAGIFQGAMDFGGPKLAQLGMDDAVFSASLAADTGLGIDAFFLNADADETYAATALDAADEIFMAGSTQGSFFIGTDNFDPTTLTGYVARYLPSGDFRYQWGKLFSGTGEQHLTGLVVDGPGSSTVAGWFKGSMQADMLPALDATDGTEDLFLVHRAVDGTATWARGVDEKGDTRPTAAAIDAAGRVVLVGSMTGAVDFGGGSLALAAGATSAAFVATFDDGGKHVDSRAFGDKGALVALGALAIDPVRGDRVVAGRLVGTADLGHGPITADDDALIAKLAAPK